MNQIIEEGKATKGTKWDIQIVNDSEIVNDSQYPARKTKYESFRTGIKYAHSWMGFRLWRTVKE